MTLTPFVRRVLTVVSRIPAGRVATYGDVARMAGRPRAARAVGQIMSTAPCRDLPYHRVVAAGGALGGYGGNVGLKAALLAAEGLTVRHRRIREFARCRWAEPAGPKPQSGRRKDAQGSFTSFAETPASSSWQATRVQRGRKRRRLTT